MPPVATAVPEAGAESIHAQLVEQYPLQHFSSKRDTCPLCGAAFIILFHDKYDEKNEKYATRLKKTIGANCENGAHVFDGYPFATL